MALLRSAPLPLMKPLSPPAINPLLRVQFLQFVQIMGPSRQVVLFKGKFLFGKRTSSFEGVWSVDFSEMLFAFGARLRE